jgi:hypothetical protein
MKTSKFRPSMITRALQAAEAMRDAPIASKLKSNGFNAAAMQKEAQALSDLRTQALDAKNAALQVTAELSVRGEKFAKMFASYCNQVRALTTDESLRRRLGVKSPGMRKGPAFKRPRKTGAEAPSTSPTTSTSVVAEPSTKGASPSTGGTNGVSTSVVGHA